MEKKKFFYLMLMMVLGIGVFSSCHEKEDEPYMTVNATSPYDIDADGSTVSFSISSNVDWTISGNKAWAKVNPLMGSGSSNVTISVDENKSAQSRSCTINVNSNDRRYAYQIQVNQVGVVPILKVSTSSIEFEADSGSEQTVSIQCNVDWNLSGVPTWIKAEPLNGNGNGTVKFTTISKNEGTSDREATITVSAGDKSETITVVQKTGYAPCWAKVKSGSEIILKNGYYAELEFSNNVKGFYAGYISAADAKPYTQQELYSIVKTMTNFSPEEIDYLMASDDIYSSTDYIFCVIPYIEDSNGNRKDGPMTQCKFKTKSSATSADAPIGNVAQTSTEWHWEVFMNSHCSKYYMLAYDGIMAWLYYYYYYDIEIAQMTKERVDLKNDYYINQRGYRMSKEDDERFLVWTWGVSDTGDFSGNINYGGVIPDDSAEKNRVNRKSPKIKSGNISRGDMRLTRDELKEKSRLLKVIRK